MNLDHLSLRLCSLGPAVRNHLWQSTVFLLLAALIALCMQKNHARVRFWIWLAASIKFLVPFSLLVTLGSTLASSHRAAATEKTAYKLMYEVSQPFVLTPTPNPAGSAIKITSANEEAWLRTYPILLATIWAIGFLSVLTIWVVYWRRVALVIRAAIEANEGPELRALRCFERSGIVRSPVRLLHTNSTLGPGVYGITRPILIWPSRVLHRLNEAEIKSILAHELCHVRRRDNLTAAIHMFVEAVFWFHPLVWWLGSRLELEREHACDELVLELTGEPQAYAESILKVCELCLETPLPCVSGVTGADLKKRIARIMAKRLGAPLGLVKIATLTAVALLSVAGPMEFGALNAARASSLSAPPAADGAQAASGQNIAGIWQGTLTPPNAQHSTRFVIRITKDPAGAYQGSLFNADQGNPPIQFTTVILQGADVKLATPGLTVAGKLSSDGRTIDASLSGLSANPVPVSFSRTNPDAAWALPEPIKPMAADANPAFDVVTIKPSQPGRQGKGVMLNGVHLRTLNTSLDDLLAFAYGLHPSQIVGAPDWANQDLFDIDGVADVPGMPSGQQMEDMLQKLLASRFELKFHRETRELSVYSITLADGGPKMTKSTSSPSDLPGFRFRGLGDLAARNMTMADFAAGLQSAVTDRPVVDHTGLTGRFDFALRWTPDESQFIQVRGGHGPAPPAADGDPNAPPGLYTALREQLGLKMEATKAPDAVIVIDHVEKPSPN